MYVFSSVETYIVNRRNCGECVLMVDVGTAS